MDSLERIAEFYSALRFDMLALVADSCTMQISAWTAPLWVQSTRSKGWTHVPPSALRSIVGVTGMARTEHTHDDWLNREVELAIADIYKMASEELGRPMRRCVELARHPECGR